MVSVSEADRRTLAAEKPRITISELPHARDYLPPYERELLDRHYWIAGEDVVIDGIAQTIVRTQDLNTSDGAIFNSERANRSPSLEEQEKFQDFLAKLNAEMEATRSTDDFCSPYEKTPLDDFEGGRVVGKYSVTARNKYPWDGRHGLVILNEHNPLTVVTREQFIDHFHTFYQWLARIHKKDPEAMYPFLLWNLLDRAGSSRRHPHFQTSLVKGRHYGKPERLITSALDYREKYEGANYFEDVFRIHEALGLGFSVGDTKVFAPLTPIKEREVRVFTDRLDGDSLDVVYDIYHTLREKMGVVSFNMSVTFPPIEDDGRDLWKVPMPVIVSFVDRGDLRVPYSDIGGMELAADSVVAHDPSKLARVLSTNIREKQTIT